MTHMEYIASVMPNVDVTGLSNNELRVLLCNKWHTHLKEMDENSVALNYEDVEPVHMILTLLREFGNKTAFRPGHTFPTLGVEEFSYAPLHKEAIDTFNTVGKYLTQSTGVAKYSIKEKFIKGNVIELRCYDTQDTATLKASVRWTLTDSGLISTDVSIEPSELFIPEAVVADKLIVLLSDNGYRRSLDLYDMYQLLNHYDLDLEVMAGCILMRNKKVAIEYCGRPINESAMEKYASAYTTLKIASVCNNAEISKPKFSEVMSCYGYLCERIRTMDFTNWKHISSNFV